MQLWTMRRPFAIQAVLVDAWLCSYKDPDNSSMRIICWSSCILGQLCSARYVSLRFALTMMAFVWWYWTSFWGGAVLAKVVTAGQLREPIRVSGAVKSAARKRDAIVVTERWDNAIRRLVRSSQIPRYTWLNESHVLRPRDTIPEGKDKRT